MKRIDQVYKFILENPGSATDVVAAALGLKPRQALNSLRSLRLTNRAKEESMFFKKTVQKHWNAIGEMPCEDPKIKPVPSVIVTIKPDLAAMWLQESKPQWETRLIPIRRSTGLGARQDM